MADATTTTTDAGAIITRAGDDVEVDVRPIIAAGGEPFDTIMQAVGELGDNETLSILNSFEPVPLEGVLSAQGFTFDATELEGGDYRVRFWRTA